MDNIARKLQYCQILYDIELLGSILRFCKGCETTWYIIKYCYILSNINRYCMILSNIVKNWQILLHIARYCCYDVGPMWNGQNKLIQIDSDRSN